jgi:anti-sigma factor RsiW
MSREELEMSCTEAGKLLHAWVDDELDVRTALEVEEHLGRCRACAAEERSLRGLQTLTREQLARHAPSTALLSTLRAALRAEAGSQAPAAAPPSEPLPVVRIPPPAAVLRSPLWRRAAVALAPAVAASVMVAAVYRRGAGEAHQQEAVVAAHVRSLLANHLTDVASSDQHTVKPWFQGKLDYSVSVVDWAEEGYPLVGGRLDYIEDAPAAALVYRRRQHVVNLFIWPLRGGRNADGEPPRHFSLRGYGAFHWAQDGMDYWAISDLNTAELEKFAALVRK